MLCNKNSDNKNRQILPMGLADIKQVTEIENSAHTHPWSEKLFLSNFGQRYFSHVLLSDDVVIGYFVASAVAGEVTLMNIAVALENQGQGAGQQLLQFLLDYSRKTEQQEVWLEVRISNETAIHLYQKLGFVEVDVRKAYYPTDNGREDAVIMCCYL
ncbi:ribosomal-protein-alanine acetyltransferase [Psychromonas marina]|uniref:[Ribosomal protein bS18]-alanine N-acetyltransferase n=1 Tax=Psychromonas marina TaxID=88364 RepID=A0ABQ6E0K1_9GAMM|nr:ribosomal protein S18-alanine N-acetyltransferase [Psychromonas marina]GLS90918.1 ribosomal-protein-alanine acetyltransferase [Psychromonas marina]